MQQERTKPRKKIELSCERKANFAMKEERSLNNREIREEERRRGGEEERRRGGEEDKGQLSREVSRNESVGAVSDIRQFLLISCFYPGCHIAFGHCSFV